MDASQPGAFRGSSRKLRAYLELLWSWVLRKTFQKPHSAGPAQPCPTFKKGKQGAIDYTIETRNVPLN